MSRSFPVALELAGKSCLVVGVSEEAPLRVAALEAAGASVVWLSGEERPAGSTADAELSSGATPDWRRVTAPDLEAAWLIVLADRNETLATSLGQKCAELKRLYCPIDQAGFGSFSHLALARCGPLTLAISTEGRLPALARRLREELERLLRESDAAARIERLANWRDALPRSERRARLTSHLQQVRLTGRLELPLPPEDSSNGPT